MHQSPHQSCHTPGPGGPDHHQAPPGDPFNSTDPQHQHTCLSPTLTKAIRKWCRVSGALKSTSELNGSTAWSHSDWSKFLWFQWAAQHRSNGPDLELLDWLLTTADEPEPDDTS